MLSPKQSGVLECHLSHYFKNENYELRISAGFFVTGKKRYSRLSVGCAVLAITTGKKKIQSSVCWVRGSGDYNQKKKDTVVCLTGCAVVLFFVVVGNFHYDRKKKDTLRPEKKKDTVVCLMGAQFWRLPPEKKRYSRLSGGLCCCISFWFWREISIFL